MYLRAALFVTVITSQRHLLYNPDEERVLKLVQFKIKYSRQNGVDS